jgi:hypothetical protein
MASRVKADLTWVLLEPDWLQHIGGVVQKGRGGQEFFY